MLFKIKLGAEGSYKEVELKAHRILKETFPQLELYVHYAIDNSFFIKEGYYSISDVNGAAICQGFLCLKDAINEAYWRISKFGIDNYLKKSKELIDNWQKEKWRYYHG